MDLIRFIMTSRPGVGSIITRESDGAVMGEGYIASAITEIAKNHHPDTPITFKWAGKEFDSFLPLSVEHWLRSTANARAVQTAERDREVETYRRLHGAEAGAFS